jgi:hypothetical protein
VPEEVGFRVWRILAGFGTRAAAFGAGLVFQSENDLVVNSSSMTQLFGDPVLDENTTPAGTVITDTYNFGTTSKVWHTNYFQQPQTVEWFKTWLSSDLA